MVVDWSRIRQEFPALRDRAFLNTATFGQLPRCATEAVARHFAHRDELACADFLAWFDDADGVRTSIARLIHCQPDDIAFVSNAASALAILLGGLDWQPGDRVVTLGNEFPNNLYYPALLGTEGVEFMEASWDGFREAVSGNTRLVLMSTVNYTNGFRPPLAEVAGFLRERNVELYLDGTQSLGALGFDASAIRPAMMAVHAYKWLLAPNGAAFFYVRPDVRERIAPNIIGWRSHRDWRNVDNLHHGAPEFVSSAEKYEGGMLPFPAIYALGASVELMLAIGPELIERRVVELAEGARSVLRRLGARLLSDEFAHYDSPIIAARFENRDASQLARELKSRGVLVSARHGLLRVSTHFYNNEQDLDCLEEHLGALL